MAEAIMFDKRPACRICGSRSHVITGHNPQSPLNNCCASCGTTLREVVAWLGHHKPVEVHKLVAIALEMRSVSQIPMPRADQAV